MIQVAKIFFDCLKNLDAKVTNNFCLVNPANKNLLKGSKKFSSKKSFSSMKREDAGRMKELKPY